MAAARRLDGLLSALILIWAPLGFGLLGYTDTYTSVPWRFWRLLSAMRQFANTVGMAALVRGEALFGPPIAARLMNYFAVPRPQAQAGLFPELTEREREVLQLIARGRNNADIAAELVLSLKTVRNHVSNIFSKLQVADRAEAIVRAREAGMH